MNPPRLYIVTWMAGTVREATIVRDQIAAEDLVYQLRAHGFDNAGWDVLDPFQGNTSEGVQ